MTILVDTCILIDLLKGRADRQEWVAQMVEDDHELACCDVTIAEVFAGMRPKESELTEELLGDLQYFETGPEIARRAGRLKYEWARKGHTLGSPDVIIAAVALENGLAVATENRRDFPMPELNLLIPPAMQ